MIKSGPYGRLIPARIFHYGWVKNPHVLRQKLRVMHSWWHVETLTDEEMNQRASLDAGTIYDVLKEFTKSHPQVMWERLSRAQRLRPRTNRWLNWRFYREVLRHGFKG